MNPQKRFFRELRPTPIPEMGVEQSKKVDRRKDNVKSPNDPKKIFVIIDFKFICIIFSKCNKKYFLIRDWI